MVKKELRCFIQAELELEDGSVVNTKDLDYKIVKPLIWWE